MIKRFESNFLLDSRCESADYRYIIHYKTGRNGYKGYSFQDDEKTIIDIDMDIVVEKEKNEWTRKMYMYNSKFHNWLNVFVGEKWLFSCLTKLLTDET